MKPKRRMVRWLVPAVVILCAGAWFALPYIVPWNVLFRWSRSSLNAYAAKVMAPGSTELMHPPGRLGFFNVLKVEPLPNGFVFQHDSCNPFDWCGFAYSTTALPYEEKDTQGQTKQINIPLGDNWYDVFRP